MDSNLDELSDDPLGLLKIQQLHPLSAYASQMTSLGPYQEYSLSDVHHYSFMSMAHIKNATSENVVAFSRADGYFLLKLKFLNK